MRYSADHKFWVVTDPTPGSVLGDVLFEASLRDLEKQFKGGLTTDEHPTLFTEKPEAEIEAYGRFTAMRAAQAVLNAGRENRIDRIEIYGADGRLVFETDLRGGVR